MEKWINSDVGVFNSAGMVKKYYGRSKNANLIKARASERDRNKSFV